MSYDLNSKKRLLQFLSKKETNIYLNELREITNNIINGTKLAKPGACCAGAAHTSLMKKSIILVVNSVFKSAVL